jgi:hypothetical protein
VYIGWPNARTAVGSEYDFPAPMELMCEFGTDFFGGSETYVWFYRKNPCDEFSVLVNTRGRLMNATHYRTFLVVGAGGGVASAEWEVYSTSSRSLLACFFSCMLPILI